MAAKTFGDELWIVLGVYLGVLLLVLAYSAFLRYRRFRNNDEKEGTLVEHFLAGRNLGPISLGFSVCASMFSGYTVVGLPAEAYSQGFSAWRWVGSCTFISIVYIAYSPRMQWLSRVRGHDSILAFVKDRYGITEQYRDPLHWLMVVILLVPCFIYLCAQFDAFGNTISTLSDGAITPMQGAIGLAVLVSLYEILGGLHAVALTDVIQGGALLIGSVFILIFMDTVFEGLPAISKKLEASDPGHIRVMDAGQGLNWAEFWIGVGVQRALFPDYPQRAMAARNQDSLRMANGILAAAPFLIQVPLLFFGLIGRVHHPDLENPKEVFTLVVLDIIDSNLFGKIVGSVMMAACVAAIMSTADSVLIVISQILTLDVIRPVQEALASRRSVASSSSSAASVGPQTVGSSEPAEVDKLRPQTPGAPEESGVGASSRPSSSSTCLIVASRVATLCVSGLCIPIVESNFDLSFMIQFQSSILAQTLPTLVVALYWRGLHKWASIAGLVVGVASGVGLVGNQIQGGILMSLFANFLVTMTVACTFPKFAEPATERHQQALLHIFWRQPSAYLVNADGSPAPGRELAPCQKEPIRTWWGLLLLAVFLPWLALPLYRQAGTIDPYLSGSPLWAVSAVMVLLLVHALLIYIVTFCWQAGKERSPTLPCAGASAACEAVSAGPAPSPPSSLGELGRANSGVSISPEQLAVLRGELQELRAEMHKLNGSQSGLVREAVRDEINALFA